MLAWLVLGVEVTTGAMLVLGFKTRYAALVAIPVLLGATWAHSGNGWLSSSTGGGGLELPCILDGGADCYRAVWR